VSDSKDIVFSGEAVSDGVRPTERSAAARPFTPEVEEKFRAQRTDLDAAYKIVDTIEKRKVPDDSVARFVAEGKLGGPGVADAAPSTKTPLASKSAATATAQPARTTSKGTTTTGKTGGATTAPWKR
jgi:hypothetical protein